MRLRLQIQSQANKWLPSPVTFYYYLRGNQTQHCVLYIYFYCSTPTFACGKIRSSTSILEVDLIFQLYLVRLAHDK